jgi:3-deoxy-D-manno-octulosonic-acid transferase
VAVINGRMSPRSFRRYQRLGSLVRWLFARVDLFAVQTAAYAASLMDLGAAPERVRVTGSVKFDGVETDRANPRTQQLRRLLNVEPGNVVWIAGSTQPPEEAIALDIFRRVRAEHPNLRLFLVPRQKERFDAVAKLLERSGLPFLRRSTLDPRSSVLDPRSSIVLVDTIGELGALWGLADLAYVGGSLDGRRGGQNMIEPAAYGAAVLFGPHVWNFRDIVARLLEAKAAIQVADAGALEVAVRRQLGDAAERQRLGTAARQFVRQQQGATERTVELIDQVVVDPLDRSIAA